MRSNIWRWILAIIITLSSAVYQRLTGPTHPLRGRVTLGEETIKFRLKRTQGGTEDHLVKIAVRDTTIQGSLLFKRYKTDDTITWIPMIRVGEKLAAALPNQPPAGKLQYDVVLERGSEQVSLTKNQMAIIRFKGEVPIFVLILHVLFIFGAMLFSNRTGIEALAKNGRLKSLSYWTVILLFLGGLILGPVVQKYAFDAYWTGWPFGTDLTDNKTLVAFLGWLPAIVALRKGRDARWWVLGAAILVLAIFLIPHSLLGSELDYSKMPDASAQ